MLQQLCGASEQNSPYTIVTTASQGLRSTQDDQHPFCRTTHANDEWPTQMMNGLLCTPRNGTIAGAEASAQASTPLGVPHRAQLRGGDEPPGLLLCLHCQHLLGATCERWGGQGLGTSVLPPGGHFPQELCAGGDR